MPRLSVISQIAEVSNALLLNNPRLVDLIDATEPQEEDGSALDVAAWELFCQILARDLDPLTEDTIDRTARIRQERSEEVGKLKHKCHELAHGVGGVESLSDLSSAVERFIRTNLEEDISDVLKLDRRATSDFVEALIIDEKSWAAMVAFMWGVVSGSLNFTAGGAVAAIASLGSKGTKTALARRNAIRSSPYAVLYRIRQFSPLE